jgi:hypothetical protein
MSLVDQSNNIFSLSFSCPLGKFIKNIRANTNGIFGMGKQEYKIEKLFCAVR